MCKKKKKIIYQYESDVTKAKGVDAPENLGLVFTYSSQEFENITYGTSFGKSDHLVLEMDRHRERRGA